MSSAFPADAFRTAVESGDLTAVVATLAADVEFRSPAVHRPYHGAQAAAQVLGAVLQVFEDFRYTAGVRDGDLEVLMFEARVGTREIQGADFLRYGPDGLITELTVMIRPLSGLTAVVEAVGTLLSGAAPTS
jgi:hypothetical protein